MKLKDIEKSLKKEHDGAKVPDVMRRAQKLLSTDFSTDKGRSKPLTNRRR